MEHHFNIDIAQKYGVDEAILLHNLNFWIQKNKANKKYFFDNDYWTYNSIEAFAELFPYWTRRQIERIINNLLNYNLIKKGNYNNSSYDRTMWYALTDLGKSIYENGEIHFTKNVNGFTQTVETIPYNNTNSNTNNKKDINTRKKIFYDEIKQFLSEYPKDMLRDFYDYWSESNSTGTKFKKELQQTFELKRRLATWAKNDKNFNKKTSIENLKFNDIKKTKYLSGDEK